MNTINLHRCIIANNPIQVLANVKGLGISLPEEATADDILDAVYAKADSMGCVDGVNKVIVPAFSVQFDPDGACAQELADFIEANIPVLIKANGHDCMGNTEVISAAEARCNHICRWLALGFVILVLILVIKSILK